MEQAAYLNNYKIYSFSSKDELLTFVEGRHNILVAMNAEKILKEDKNLKALVNRNIGYPDGVGAVLALKQKGFKPIKIPGVELWINIIQRYYKTKSFYLIGASENVVNQTVINLRRDYKGINIKNFRNGYISDDHEFDQLKKDIIQKKPDIVFVAMGSPKQEFLMDKLLHIHPALYMGLGGSFDVYSGNKKRAPNFYQKMSLEWFYRLLKEPTRFKRQIALWKFLFLLSMGKL